MGGIYTLVKISNIPARWAGATFGFFSAGYKHIGLMGRVHHERIEISNIPALRAGATFGFFSAGYKHIGPMGRVHHGRIEITNIPALRAGLTFVLFLGATNISALWAAYTSGA